jgi:hypothetical protein
VDQDRLKAIFPYGQARVHVKRGGLDVEKPGGGTTVIANAALSVSFEMEPTS